VSLDYSTLQIEYMAENPNASANPNSQRKGSKTPKKNLIARAMFRNKNVGSGSNEMGQSMIQYMNDSNHAKTPTEVDQHKFTVFP